MANGDGDGPGSDGEPPDHGYHDGYDGYHGGRWDPGGRWDRGPGPGKGHDMNLASGLHFFYCLNLVR